MARKSQIPFEQIERSILLVRGKRVMIDADLAFIFGVTTRRLRNKVRKNIDRFPPDFMFELTADEKSELEASCERLQNLKSSSYRPFAFTEHGALMLASVLDSGRAIRVSLHVVRTFARLGELMALNPGLARRLDRLEEKHKRQFKVVFDAIRPFVQLPEWPKNPMGFRVSETKTEYEAGKGHGTREKGRVARTKRASR